MLLQTPFVILRKSTSLTKSKSKQWPAGYKLGLGYRSCAIHSHGTFKDRILPGNVAGYGVVVLVREMGTVYEPAPIVAPP